ncbi:MAG: hypothetical protein QMC93_00345 [Patescibacteria group bacterium]|nr:hypothetical protein [Patescibacteria group bacterium]
MKKLQRKLNRNKKIKWSIFDFVSLSVLTLILFQSGIAFKPVEFRVNVPQAQAQAYIEIPLHSKNGAASVVPGDLDGDGMFDYVAKTPQQANNDGTYHLEAYKSNGDFLWDFDLGIGNDGIDGGPIWWNSYTVWDLDGDNKAEVIARIKQDGKYYLAVIDGLNKTIKKKVSWPSPPDWGNWEWNRNEDRHVMAIAYLDGNNPSIILQVGTYAYGGNPPEVKGRVKLQAYDKNLNLIWARQGLGDGVAGHGIRIIDYDRDGRDEIVQGSNLIDENGNLVWTKNLGHVDRMLVGNIDPANPGYEIFYSQEPWGNWEEHMYYKAGNYLVAMDNGNILWKDTGYTHLHSAEWCADVTKDYPGWECWSFDAPPNDAANVPLLYSSKGEIIDHRWLYNRAPIWWDDDDVWELLSQSGENWQIRNYPALDVVLNVKGNWAMQGDLMGDYRDELLVTETDKIRIYTNTEPSGKELPSPLQDRYYRLSLSRQGTGYYHNVQLLDPEEYYGAQPPCTCTSWQDDGKCQDKGCRANEVPQKRTCTPAGCEEEKRCVEKPICLTLPSLFLKPSSGTYNVEDKFKIEVRLNTSDQGVLQPVVGVSAYLNYDKAKLKALSINSANSVFPIKAEEEIADGLIKISRGRATPGVNGNELLVAEIEFEAIGAGEARVNFSLDEPYVSRIIKDDGQGTDILKKTIGGVYQISGEAPPAKTCAEQGGDICGTNETCFGSWLSASDTSRCCSQRCLPPGPPIEKAFPHSISDRIRQIEAETGMTIDQVADLYLTLEKLDNLNKILENVKTGVGELTVDLDLIEIALEMVSTRLGISKKSAIDTIDTRKTEINEEAAREFDDKLRSITTGLRTVYNLLCLKEEQGTVSFFNNLLGLNPKGFLAKLAAEIPGWDEEVPGPGGPPAGEQPLQCELTEDILRFSPGKEEEDKEASQKDTKNYIKQTRDKISSLFADDPIKGPIVKIKEAAHGLIEVLAIVRATIVIDQLISEVKDLRWLLLKKMPQDWQDIFEKETFGVDISVEVPSGSGCGFEGDNPKEIIFNWLKNKCTSLPAKGVYDVSTKKGGRVCPDLTGLNSQIRNDYSLIRSMDKKIKELIKELQKKFKNQPKWETLKEDLKTLRGMSTGLRDRALLVRGFAQALTVTSNKCLCGKSYCKEILCLPFVANLFKIDCDWWLHDPLPLLDIALEALTTTLGVPEDAKTQFIDWAIKGICKKNNICEVPMPLDALTNNYCLTTWIFHYLLGLGEAIGITGPIKSLENALQY